MSEIQPQPGVLDIELYVGGKATVEGVKDVVKLSSNENPLGCSDAVTEFHAKTGFNLHRYPSTDHAELRQAIGQFLEADETTTQKSAQNSVEILQRMKRKACEGFAEEIGRKLAIAFIALAAAACKALADLAILPGLP